MSFLTMRQAREKSGLTVAEIAITAKCDRSTLYRIEDGRTLPKRKTARALFALYKGEVPLALIYDPQFSGEVRPAW